MPVTFRFDDSKFDNFARRTKWLVIDDVDDPARIVSRDDEPENAYEALAIIAAAGGNRTYRIIDLETAGEFDEYDLLWQGTPQEAAERLAERR